MDSIGLAPSNDCDNCRHESSPWHDEPCKSCLQRTDYPKWEPVAIVARPTKAVTNPKQAYGDKKPPLHLIHMIAQLHESAALASGKLKYGENNYLHTPVEAMTYVGAILRHLGQWVSGERVDQKELVHHLGAIRACTNILLSAEATGMLIDNRPRLNGVVAQDEEVTYSEATRQAFAEVEATIEHLNKLYPEGK